MTRIRAYSLAFAVLICLPALHAQDDTAVGPFTPDQLDDLLAPVALYPDPLLAQILLAATFPDQVDEAARFLRAGADPNAIDGQPWDVSVKDRFRRDPNQGNRCRIDNWVLRAVSSLAPPRQFLLCRGASSHGFFGL